MESKEPSLPIYNYLKSFPPGYRFHPSHEELIVYYLIKKVNNQPLPPNRMVEVDLYQHNPEHLAEIYREWREENEWYFFTPRDRKYQNGTRPRRSAGDGYWKATGSDKVVTHEGNIVGYRRALVFYAGKQPRGDKTNWLMQEYKVHRPSESKRFANAMRLDDWVLCRIYKKSSRKTTPKPAKDSKNKSRAPHQEKDEHKEEESEPSAVTGASSTNATGNGNADTDPISLILYFNFNQPCGATQATGNQINTICFNHQVAGSMSQTYIPEEPKLLPYNNMAPHTNVAVVPQLLKSVGCQQQLYPVQDITPNFGYQYPFTPQDNWNSLQTTENFWVKSIVRC